MNDKCSRCSDKVNLWNETEENGVINHAKRITKSVAILGIMAKSEDKE